MDPELEQQRSFDVQANLMRFAFVLLGESRGGALRGPAARDVPRADPGAHRVGGREVLEVIDLGWLGAVGV